ncbi:MAG TPA: MOSC N-terminal beta barrel domain-containing protein [Acidimicrobiales bacterium]|nr:MOSC N-terminal beta barrel domain-containing protein [Acidimicrobiales bacterium]
MSQVGQVTQLWRFPVKSMQGERVANAQVITSGIEGDRMFALRDAEGGRVLSAKRWGKLLEATARLDGDLAVVTLPTGTQVRFGESDAQAVLSQWFGRPVTFERADPESAVTYEVGIDPMDADSATMEFPCPPGTFLDAAAVHLMTSASLAAALSIAPGSSWDLRRFRPGIVVQVPGEGFVEEEWIGSELVIGGARLIPFAPTVRCAMPTRSQPALGELAALDADKGVIRALTDNHNNCLGIYAAVKEPGPIRVGDSVQLI